MDHEIDPSDLKSLILTRIIQKERPHKLSPNCNWSLLRENRERENDTPTCIDTLANYCSRTIPRERQVKPEG